MRLLCTKTLTNAGYLVLDAEGSSEAMALYTGSTEPIDLLLIDLFLPPPDFQLSSVKTQYPRVNGYDLIQQALSVTKDVRVLFMSSHPIASLQTEGIHIESERFLLKPFSAERLLSHVAATLAGAPMHAKAATTTIPGKDIRWVD